MSVLQLLYGGLDAPRVSVQPGAHLRAPAGGSGAVGVDDRGLAVGVFRVPGAILRPLLDHAPPRVRSHGLVVARAPRRGHSPPFIQWARSSSARWNRLPTQPLLFS